MSLARVNLLLAAAVVLAALLPLTLQARGAARERALDEADRVAAVVVAALAITDKPATIGSAIATVDAHWRDRIGVHGLGPKPVGTPHATAEQIKRAVDEGRALVLDVDGGAVHLEPVHLGAPRLAIVEVFVPEEELTRGVSWATWWIWVLVALALIIAMVIANDLIAGRAARSSRRLAAAAQALGDGDLTVRTTVCGPRESAEAAASFNTMADRISAQLTAERELIADRSHRLRTPLTALRLELERLGPAASASRLSQAVESMEREVDHVIRTARHTPDPPQREPEDQCDAAEVVRERMSFWSAVAEDQSRPFGVFGTAFRAPVPLPRSELAAAVDALLGNVFRYTPQGTAFEIEVSRRDGYVAVRVDDAGPGIADPKEALRRGASERGSTGLGLDIARAAAEAGRGALHIDRAALGGASVVVLLADAQAPRRISRQRLAFVGRLSREPDERRWGRRGPAALVGDASPLRRIGETKGEASPLRHMGEASPLRRTAGRVRAAMQLSLMSFLSLVGRLSARQPRR